MSALSLLAKLKQLDISVELMEERLKINAPKGALTPGLVAELKEKKEEIIRFLQKDVRGQVKFESIEPGEKKEYYELSSAQKRLYFLQQFNPERTDYNKPDVTELNEFTDPRKLEDTFKKLIGRHESLRTSFRMLGNRPVQKIHPHVEFQLEYRELGEPVDGDPASIPGDIFLDFVRPFDLSRVPLLRVLLVKNSKKKFLLMVDIHHILSDGVSKGILLQDFGALYSGRPLPPLKLQYKDYAQWQNSKSQKDSVKRQESFWLEQFSGELPVLYLPTDYDRPSNRSMEGDWFYFEINRADTAALREIALRTGATLYIVLLALYNILVAKLSGQEDIIIGTIAAGRPHADLQKIIGMFVNTLALRNFPSGEKTFDEFLNEVKQRTLRAFENQDYQFEDLVEKVGVWRDPSRNPLFDVRFALQNMAENNGESPPENSNREAVDNRYINRVSKFDLSLYGMERGDGLFFGFEYCTRLFQEKTIEVFSGYFKKIISQALAAPDERIKSIELLTGEEKTRMLAEINAGQREYPKTPAIDRLFEDQVRKTPDNTAIVYKNSQLTFRELNAGANRLAWLLRDKGVKPRTIVAVMLNRGSEELTAIFGIMKAGGAYLPLDPACGDHWTEFILADSCSRWLVCGGRVPEHVTDGRETIVMTEFNFAAYSTLNPDGLINEGYPAYVAYTFGSAVRPRGILMEHGPVVDLLHRHSEFYPVVGPGRFLLKSSLQSDISVLELFGWIPGGGGVVLLEKKEEDNSRSIYDTLERGEITHIYFLPWELNAFVTYLIRSESHDLPGLKYLFHVGNQHLTVSANFFEKEGFGVSLENLYRLPEFAFYASRFSLSHWDGDGKMPIGKPVPNVKLVILDRLGRLQGAGIPGDIYMSGDGSARGYLNDPELTAEKWVVNPLVKGGKLFKTGDYGRYLHDSGIEFWGSSRHRVKIEGALIDVSDIESKILRYFGTKEAVVIPKHGEDGEVSSLAAYFTMGREITVSELRSYLSRELPDYMVPQYFVPMKEMPFTPDGKIDRNRLPEAVTVAHPGYVPPGSETEEALCEIWAEILEIPKAEIGVEDNFFEIGGGSNSLHLIMLASKIYEKFEIQIPITQIYNNPVIREVAKYLESKNSVNQPVVLLNRLREKKLFCFPPRIAYGFLYTPLASLLDDYSLYAFNFIEEEDRLARYVDIIKELQPLGPYVLFGMCAAGRLTMQVANALEKSGCEVSDIIFADSLYIESYPHELSRDYYNEYYGDVAYNLEKLGLSHLKEEVIAKTGKYMKYYLNLPPLEVVNADLHLVLSDQVQLRIQKGESVGTADGWDRWTTKRTLLYKGFGMHEEMFSPGSLEKNTEIIRDILGTISS
ncbi:MAG: AMP-binding protein [bacterium]|nr:AMP-binding protein [bacterium]